MRKGNGHWPRARDVLGGSEANQGGMMPSETTFLIMPAFSSASS